MASETVKSAYRHEYDQQRLAFWRRKIRELNEKSMADPWGFDYHDKIGKLIADYPKEKALIKQAEKDWSKN